MTYSRMVHNTARQIVASTADMKHSESYPDILTATCEASAYALSMAWGKDPHKLLALLAAEVTHLLDNDKSTPAAD